MNAAKQKSCSLSSSILITVKCFVGIMRKDAKRLTSSMNFKDALLMLDEHQGIQKQ